MKQPLYMIDIETTGVNKKTDDILEVAVLELDWDADIKFWRPGRSFREIIHTEREPENAFAKEHMAGLYAECNNCDPDRHTAGRLKRHLYIWLHNLGSLGFTWNNMGGHIAAPKFFTGLNASTFDLPFMFEKGLLTPSYYAYEIDGKEVLRGDAHYRVYEMTGAILAAVDSTGMSWQTVKALVNELAPDLFELPKGKLHDALYDCYKQARDLNGIIALNRSGIKR